MANILVTGATGLIGDIIGGLIGKPPYYEVGPAPGPIHIMGDIAKMKRLLGPPGILFSGGVADVCAVVQSVLRRPR